MNERPILFSAPMVRAILDGSKTQTRRIWKMPKGMEWYVSGACRGEETGDICDIGGKGWWTVDEVRCPYGRPGDRLWVREAWAYHPDFAESTRRAIYRAEEGAEYDVDRWRPSIHMPRWASRITLEITGVRVERLQEIHRLEAIAEGIERADDFFSCPCWKVYGEPDGADVSAPDDPIGSYRSLWESINGPGSWDANPWVWVIEFRRVQLPC